jgi:hypothetical protein
MLQSPVFNAIWNAIKGWDISRHNNGIYSGPTGNDARHIFDALPTLAPVMPDPTHEQTQERIAPGLYRVFWASGGDSLCAIGMTSNGDNWIAPSNWLRPAMIRDLKEWGEVSRIEPLPDPTPREGEPVAQWHPGVMRALSEKSTQTSDSVEAYKVENAKHGWTGRSFAFAGGCINLDRHGNAEFVFDMDECDPYYEEGKSLMLAKVPASEIVELRDLFIKTFPDTTSPSVEALIAERDEALKEIERLIPLASAYDYLESPARAEAAEAENAALKAALEPFAEVADGFDADGRVLADSDGIYANTAGDFRRARAALQKDTDNE